MIKEWLTDLYEGELEEVKSAISNERVWVLGSSTREEELMHRNNIFELEVYKGVLLRLIEQLK